MEAKDSHHGPFPKRYRKDKSTDSNQEGQGAQAVDTSIVNQHEVNHSQAVTRIMRAQLRMSSIPGSVVHGKVEELEGKKMIFRRELKAIHA